MCRWPPPTCWRIGVPRRTRGRIAIARRNPRTARSGGERGRLGLGRDRRAAWNSACWPAARPTTNCAKKYFEARHLAFPSAGINTPNTDQEDKASRAKALGWLLGEKSTPLQLVSADLNEDSWQKLDTLYQDIETDLGRKPTPLARPDLRTANAIAASRGRQAAAENRNRRCSNQYKDRLRRAKSPNASKVAWLPRRPPARRSPKASLRGGSCWDWSSESRRPIGVSRGLEYSWRQAEPGFAIPVARALEISSIFRGNRHRDQSRRPQDRNQNRPDRP